MKLLLRNIFVGLARMFGSKIRDQRTGNVIGRAFVVAWRGRVHFIGLEGVGKPVFLPQRRLTYWRQELGLESHEPPDAQRLGPDAASAQPAATERPKLLLVTSAIGAGGSEAGKGFAMARALMVDFEIHLCCAPECVEWCAGLSEARQWKFHVVGPRLHGNTGWRFYRVYREWCRAVETTVPGICREHGITRLHHVTLGSFRFFPKYDRTGVEYSIGPLGGGEQPPLRLALGAGLPIRALIEEGARWFLNRTIVLRPGIRRVLEHSIVTYATTRETEDLLKSAGAQRTRIVFPDVAPLESQGQQDEVRRLRADQAAAIATEFRGVFSGRALWWKGGQLAIRWVERLRRRGVNATLDLYTHGEAVAGWQRLAAQLGVGDACRFRGFVPREELLAAYRNAHVFVYPTLHDSSSSAIPEAYSTGLPSFTLGLGGMQTASHPGAGVNHPPASIDNYLDRCVDTAISWQKNPAEWLAASECALAHTATFSPEALRSVVLADFLPAVTPAPVPQ
jgi:glycosyltransferase involved in cell wall biosynthesis